jgi:hypothetical protein
MRATLESPYQGEPYCEVWFAAFDPQASRPAWGFHKKFPIAELQTQKSPHRVRIGEHAEVTDRSFRGQIAAGGHSAEWDLTWLPAPEVHKHLPDLLYKTARVDTKVC